MSDTTNVGLTVLADSLHETLGNASIPGDSPPSKADVGYVAASPHAPERVCQACGFFDDMKGQGNFCNLLKDTVARLGHCNFYVPGGRRPNSNKGADLSKGPDDVQPTGGHQ